MTTEEHFQHLLNIRKKILELRSLGGMAERDYWDEYGGYFLIEYYKKEMIRHGIIKNEEEW